MYKDSKRTTSPITHQRNIIKQSQSSDYETGQLRDEIVSLHSYMHKREK